MTTATLTDFVPCVELDHDGSWVLFNFLDPREVLFRGSYADAVSFLELHFGSLDVVAPQPQQPFQPA